MIEIKTINNNDPFLEDVYNLIQVVYQERVRQGMRFWSTTVTYDEFVDEFRKNNAIVIVATDANSHELVGSGTMYIKHSKSHKYAHYTNAVVLPSRQREGIGSKIKEFRDKVAILSGCEYITCTTGVNAISSVNWHLKNGYKIIGRVHWLGYDSYVFRKQLTPSALWKNDLFCKLVYIISCCKLTLKKTIKSILRK